MAFDWIRRLFTTEHEWTQENLSAYMDDMLDPKEQALVEAHLQECAGCRQELATLRQTVDLLHLMPEVPLPRSFLVPVSEAREQAQPRRLPALGVLRTASAMATLLFVLVLSGNLLLRMGYGAEVAQVLEPIGTEEAVDGVYGLTERSVPEQEMPAEAVVETVLVEKQVAKVQKEGERLPSTATPAGLGGGPPADQTPVDPTGGASPLPRGVPEIMAQKAVTERLEVEKRITKEGADIEAVEAPVIPPTDTPLSTPPASPPLTAFAEAAETDVAQTVVAKAPLAEAQKTAPERPAEPATRAEASSARQRLRALLDGLLWALLLATVALWGVTAVVSKRRH